MSVEGRPIWATSLVVFYCLIGIVVSSSAGMVFGVLSLADYIKGHPESGFYGIWSGVTFGVIAAVGIPALALGLRSLWRNRTDASRSPSKTWLVTIIAFPLGLGLGYWIYVTQGGPPLFGTFAQVMALGSPILTMAVLVQLTGQSISAMRAWTHFLLGLWLIPTIAFFTELMMLIVGAFILLGGLMLSPSGRRLLQQLQGPPGRLFSQPPPEFVTQAVAQPWVLALGVLFIALLIPLVEEALKSVAIWPILSRAPSASQAFVGGALGGLGFALVEGMFLTQPDTTWFSTAFIRGGASMMHALAAGITAWGLAEAFVRRRFWRLPLAYLTAVSLHGLWNLSAVSLGMAQLGSDFGLTALSHPAQNALVVAGGVLLAFLSVAAVAGLPLIAGRLARQAGPLGPESPPEPDTPLG